MTAVPIHGRATTAEITYAGVLAAAEAIAPHLPPTPAWSYPLLDQAAGGAVVVKHENVQPTGAFKVRGGINLALGLSADERAAGLVTASTGNHAQSVCFGARLVGATAVIVVPESAPARKVAAVRALGGEVVVHGPTMDEAVDEAKRLAGERGLHYVDPGNEPAIVHGHATVYLELLQRYPDLEAIYVPVGSGTGASGACVVRDVLAPSCRVVAVQSSAAPAAHDAWRAGRPAQVPCRTRSSGLATGTSYALPQRVMAERLDDFVLVSDDDLDDAAALLATHAHTLAESAGAAALAGLLADRNRPPRCAVVVTGGNASAAEIRAVAGRVDGGTTHP
jgi:threonine dehydratase